MLNGTLPAVAVFSCNNRNTTTAASPIELKVRKVRKKHAQNQCQMSTIYTNSFSGVPLSRYKKKIRKPFRV